MSEATQDGSSMNTTDEKLIKRVEDRLAGKGRRIRSGQWVKDAKNRVGFVLSTHSKNGKKWAHIRYESITVDGRMKKKTRAIWCDELRPT